MPQNKLGFKGPTRAKEATCFEEACQMVMDPKPLAADRFDRKQMLLKPDHKQLRSPAIDVFEIPVTDFNERSHRCPFIMQSSAPVASESRGPLPLRAAPRPHKNP